MAEEIDITAFKHVPWGGDTGDGDIVVWDEDLSGATFLWAFGAASDLAQDIALANAAAGSQGVSASYSASYTHTKTGQVGAATLIRGQIDESTMEGLTYSGVADLELEHALYVTPASGLEFVLAFGTMTIKQLVADA